MRYGLLSAALAVFAVSVLLSLGKLRQSHEAALETSGVSLWLAFQADYELQRLLHALDLRALGEGQVGHDELVARLDIFWSRLPLLIQGQDSSAITRVTAARALVSDMIRQLERIEPALLALQPGDRAAYAEVRRRLAQFQEPLRQLSLEIDQTLGREQARLQEQVSGLYSGHAMYMVGILGSSAVFIFLLILESARTRRLLAATMAARARVAHLAHHDALTDLPNRILFQDRLQQALARASRQNNWIAIHCLDLDHFKDVNDRHGHAIGDAILVAATRRILPCLRKSDTLARLGGDEFAVIQTDLHDAPGAALLARRMIQALLQPFAVEDRVLSLSASIGIALFPDDGRESAQLLRHADAALYEAKAAGRGTARFYSSEMSREARARHRIEQDLLAAIRSGDLELHYQPRYTAIGQRLVGMEALLRWNRPGYGMLQPEDFVPIAEQCGLIAAIGSWVIRTACAQNRRWQEAGFPALRVAVNLSPAQFAAQDLVSEICAILKETGLEAQHLELEITDSVLLQETQRNLATLNELRALGLHLSLDDFGAGYSRLNYLLSFRFETLKLDRSFVRNLGTGGPGEPVCRALLAMAHSLNMAVVAEGVETADQLAGLEAIGCDQCQGSYFGAPEPARAFERRLCALMAA